MFVAFLKKINKTKVKNKAVDLKEILIKKHSSNTECQNKITHEKSCSSSSVALHFIIVVFAWYFYQKKRNWPEFAAFQGRNDLKHMQLELNVNSVTRSI